MALDVERLVRLNLGCGALVKPGFVNVDRLDLPGVNIVVDLNQTPWPFPDGYAWEAQAMDLFEHLDDLVSALREVHRVVVPHGWLVFKGPLAFGPNHFADVTHRRAFQTGCMDHFDPSTAYGQRYQYWRSTGPFRVARTRPDGADLIFELEVLPWDIP